jgi:toxin ParE1/3/4
MVRIKWLKSAKLDLKEIYEFIAPDSKRYARFQVEKIQKRTEILKVGNVVGKKVIEINDENIRELIEGNYRIIYRTIFKTEVHILLIHHGARDLNKRI